MIWKTKRCSSSATTGGATRRVGEKGAERTPAGGIKPSRTEWAIIRFLPGATRASTPTSFARPSPAPRGSAAPASSDRILRLLRAKGIVNYVVVSRRESQCRSARRENSCAAGKEDVHGPRPRSAVKLAQHFLGDQAGADEARYVRTRRSDSARPSRQWIEGADFED